jgi:hypothetical protein
LLKCSAGRFVAIRSRGLVNFAERFVFVAFVRFRSLDKIKIITIKKINQAFFYVFFRFFVFSLFSAGLRASFSPYLPDKMGGNNFYLYFFNRVYDNSYMGKRGK